MDPEQQLKIQKFYKFHSSIYDYSRWMLLFGRTHIINRLPRKINSSINILEIGCGTGHNIFILKKKYSEAIIYGFELSKEMFQKAKQKTRNLSDVYIINKPFSKKLLHTKMDIILISYVLSMTEEYFRKLVDEAITSLRPGGILAIVDFHDTNNTLFKNQMKRVHVRVDGKILSYLKYKLPKHFVAIRKPYLGLWSYFIYIGILEDKLK